MIKLIIILIFIPFLLSSQDLGEWVFVEQLKGFTRAMGCHDSTDCWIINQSDGDQSHYMYKSSDQGRSWYQTFSISAWDTEYPVLLQSRTAFSPHSDDYYIYFTVDKLAMLKSTDGGFTFKRTNLLADTLDPGIPLMQNKNVGTISTVDSVVDIEESPYRKYYYSYFVTFDGWKTYQKRIRPKPFSELSLKIIDTLEDGTLRLLQEGRFINHYNIYNDTWEEIGEAVFAKNAIADIYFVNDSLGFAITSETTGVGHTQYDAIFKTTNGGCTFVKQVDTLIKSNPWGLQNVAFYDENNGIVVGASGKVWMTNDGGKKWHCWECDSKVSPEVFRRDLDSLYGPWVLFVMWAGRNPIISTRMGGNMYRYEGNFFKFKDPMKAPNLVFPEDSSSKQENKITFKWEVVKEAQYYNFELSETPDMLNPIYEMKTGGNQVIYDKLKPFTNYYWRVESENQKERKWSEVFTFRTKLLPPTIQEPECNKAYDANSLLFIWDSLQNIQYYEFQLSKDNGFNNLLIDNDSLQPNSIIVKELEDSTIYYWRVKGYNEDEESEWTNTCKFTIIQSTSVIGEEEQFRIYPNPAKNELLIEITNIYQYPDYEISDMLGRIVQKGCLESNQILLEDFPKGIYFIKLIGTTETKSMKFVVGD